MYLDICQNYVFNIFIFISCYVYNCVMGGGIYQGTSFCWEGVQKSREKMFSVFLDQYFIKTWMKKKLIIMFNYNDGEGDSWQREM